MTITNEDVVLIRKFEDIRKRGYYCSGSEVTDVYNRVLGKHVPSTNCSSCIKARIQELVDALNRFERMSQKLSENVNSLETQNEASEASKEVEVDNTKEEENKELTEAEKMKEKMAKVRAAKNKK